MKTKKIKAPKVIGRRELVSFPDLGIDRVDAKIDTGAYTCALHCTEIGENTEGTEKYLWFCLPDYTNSGAARKEFRFHSYSKKRIRSSSGDLEERYVIKTPVCIGKRRINTTISLTNRGVMRHPVLIGRKFLKRKFIVDVSQLHTGGLAMSTFFNTFK
jgi:hypothetical protein